MQRSGTGCPPGQRVGVAVLCLVIGLGMGRATAQELASKVIERKLDNGLTILMYERHQAPVVAVNMRFKVGGVDEVTGLTGIAHLLEHMLFKGTTTLGTRDWEAERKVIAQIDQVGGELDAERDKGSKADPEKLKRLQEELKRLQEEEAKYIVKDEMDQVYSTAGGVGLNASTSNDFTTYVVSVPSNKLELWMALESDRMRHPVLREFYIERDNVLEERRQRVDSDPDGTLWETFVAAAFQAHPYRNPVIGWPSDVSLLPKAAVQSFLETYYSPNNAVVAFVGDVHPEQVMSWMQRYFADIPPKTIPRRVVTVEPEQKGERRVSVRFDAQPQLLMGFHKPAPPARADYVLDVASTVLSEGRTSRLYHELVEGQQLAASVSASNGAPGGRYDNLFILGGTPRHPHTAQELETGILGVIEKMKREPISASELEKARNQLRASFVRGLNSNAGLGAQLTSTQQMVGDWHYLDTYDQVIATVTADEVMQTMRRYFTPENRTVATLVTAASAESPGASAGSGPAEKPNETR
jgi:predicted Zn-dependent peptidase